MKTPAPVALAVYTSVPAATPLITKSPVALDFVDPADDPLLKRVIVTSGTPLFGPARLASVTRPVTRPPSASGNLTFFVVPGIATSTFVAPVVEQKPPHAIPLKI